MVTEVCFGAVADLVVTSLRPGFCSSILENGQILQQNICWCQMQNLLMPCCGFWHFTMIQMLRITKQWWVIMLYRGAFIRFSWKGRPHFIGNVADGFLRSLVLPFADIFSQTFLLSVWYSSCHLYYFLGSGKMAVDYRIGPLKRKSKHLWPIILHTIGYTMISVLCPLFTYDIESI